MYLPERAVVHLKQGHGGARTGQVVGLGPKELVLRNSGDLAAVPLTQIDRVEFDERSPIYAPTGVLVIRGEGGGAAPEEQHWPGLPPGSVRWAGERLEVELGSLAPLLVRGIRGVSEQSVWVARRIALSADGQVRLTVSARDKARGGGVR